VDTSGDDETAPNAVPRSRWVLWFVNVALIIGALALVAIPAEFLFRHRYAHLLYTPRAEVRAVQQYLTLDPLIGFSWQPNVSPQRDVRFVLNDTKPPPLSTDAFGIINLQEAIAQYSAGDRPDVIGLGDSFMEIAHRGFYEHFSDAGWSYYSLAIHRQCPPQYNLLLRRHAPAMHPRVILYGLFENDFNETADYLAWKTTGLDWFTYHSGTWCGPPIGASRAQRFLRTRARGWYAFGRILNANLRGERMTLTGPSRTEIERVTEHIVAARHRAQILGARFVLLLIPSKRTATIENTLEADAYDVVVEHLPGFHDTEVLDFRPVFREHPDPSSLYYEKDGHWNERGVTLAAAQLLERLESQSP